MLMRAHFSAWWLTNAFKSTKRNYSDPNPMFKFRSCGLANYVCQAI